MNEKNEMKSHCKTYRERATLTRRQVVIELDKLGHKISEGTLYNMEQNPPKHVPSYGTIVVLSRLYGCNCEDLFTPAG